MGAPVDKLTPILEIIASAASAQEWDELLAIFAEKMTRIVAADGCTIARWEQEEDTIVIISDYVSPAVETPCPHTVKSSKRSHTGALLLLFANTPTLRSPVYVESR